MRYPEATRYLYALAPRGVQLGLDRMERASCIDSSPVYANGVSNGGGFTARLGCEMADRLAAIAPVAGGYDPLKRCKPARPLPLCRPS